MTVYNWDVIASNNANADSAINWAEGMEPALVNDSARAMMGRVKELVVDLGGATVAGGSANVLTVAAGVGFTTYANGRILSFRAAANNSQSSTLNVNSIGARPLMKASPTGVVALSGGEIKATGIYLVQYSTAINSGSGGWLLVNPTPENIATVLAGLTTKTTPVDADSLILIDSADSNAPKRVTWARVKAVIETAFNSVYALRTLTITGSGLASGGGALTANRAITVSAASQAQAQAGSSNEIAMTPLRTHQAVPSAISNQNMGGLGTYSFLYNVSGSSISGGDTALGSGLRYGSTLGAGSGAPGGTWQAMSPVQNGSAAVFLRVA